MTRTNNNFVGISLPFHPSEGYKCGNACVLMVLSYFQKRSEHDLHSLDSILGYNQNEYLYLTQIASAFDKLRFDISYFVNKDEFSEYLNRDPILLTRNFYGEEGKRIVQHTNFTKVKASMRYLIDKYGLVDKQPSILEVEQHLREGHAIICCIDFGKLKGHGIYKGHYIVITGVDEQYIYFHDPGPKTAEQNCRMRIDIFDSVRNICFFDYNTLVVKGERNDTTFS